MPPTCRCSSGGPEAGAAVLLLLGHPRTSATWHRVVPGWLRRDSPSSERTYQGTDARRSQCRLRTIRPTPSEQARDACGTR